MSKFTGNIIRLPAVTPTQNSASGVYTLDDQFTAQSSGTWPIVRDQYFNYTTLLLTGAVQGTAYPNPVTQPYSFLSDASTNNFVVSPNGDVSARPFNPYLNNYSNYFTGSATYLTAGVASNWQFLNSGASDYTIEAWVYLYSVSSQQFICATNAAGAAVGFNFSVSSSAALVLDFTRGVGGSFATFTSTGTLTANAWNHVAVTFATSGKTASFYINGATAGSSSNTGYSYSASNPANTLNIGREPSGTGLVTGYISNLRITNTLVYSGAFTPSAAPLTAVSGTSLLTCQSNRFRDASTNGYTITPSGSPAVAQNSPFVSYDTTNGSGYFDGTGDQLTVANNSAFDFGSGDFTVEAWCYFTGSTGSVINYSNGQSSNSNFAWEIYQVSATSIQIGIYQSTTSYVASSTALVANAWNHVAGVRNGNTLTIYVNGVAGGTTANVTGVTANNPASATVKISGYNNATSFITGYVSNARIVKGTAVYTGAFTPPTAPLTAITNTQLLTLQTRAPATNNGFIDSSPNNFVVTRNGNTTQGSFSPFSPTGWGNYFDGTGDYLATPTAQTPLTLNTDDFTLECWYYLPTQVQANTCLICSSNSSSITNALLVQLATTTNAWELYINGTNLLASASGRSATLNTWQHIAITRSGSTFNFYLNGVAATGVSTSSASISVANWLVGYWYLAVHALTGYISNLRIVKGVVVYTGNFTPPTSPLTAISGTSLLTCQSNRFRDASPNNFTITVNGTPSVQAFSPFAPAQSYIPSQIGGSGYFDGTGSGTAADYLTVPDSPVFTLGSGDFTLETWIYSTVGSGVERYYIAHTDNATAAASQFALYQRSTDAFILFEYYVSTTANSITSGAAITLNQWNHIAVCRSNGTLSMFVNGVRPATGTTNISTTAFNDSASSLGIGGRTSGAALLTGNISGMRLVRGTDIYGASNTTITVPTAPLTAIPNTSLLLNFTNGGIVDATSKNDLETVGNAQISTTQSKWGGGSMYFDGNDDQLKIPSSPVNTLGSGDFTIEMWVRWDNSKTGNQIVLDQRPLATDGAYPMIFISGTGTLNYFVSGATRITTTATVTANDWSYIAIRRSSGTTQAFINGSSSGSSWSDTTNYLQNTIVIGDSQSVPADNAEYKGYIDDIRISRYARTITASPTAPFPLG